MTHSSAVHLLEGAAEATEGHAVIHLLHGAAEATEGYMVPSTPWMGRQK